MGTAIHSTVDLGRSFGPPCCYGTGPSDGSLRSQLNPRRGKVVGIEFAARSAASLLASNADGTATVADAAQELPLAILDGPSNALRTASFSPDRTRVVGASWDGTARVWQAASPYRRWAAEPVGDGCDIDMSSRPDRRFIAVGCRGLPTRVWNTAHDRLLAELPSATPIDAKDFTSAATAVSAAGDLAAVARGMAAKVYGLPGGQLLRTLEHGAAVSVIAFTD